MLRSSGGAAVLAVVALVAVGLLVVGPGPAAASETGRVSFDRGPYEGPGDEARITLHDWDLNYRARSWPVRVTSTADPVGISVRLYRLDPQNGGYQGRLGFSDLVSNDAADRIRVTDGSEVTVSYTDPEGADGRDQRVTATVGWSGRSRRPDDRVSQILYTNVEQPEVRGVVGSVPFGSTVGVWADPVANDLLGAAAAGQDGRFSVRFGSPEAPPAKVWLSAQDGSYPDSPRIEVRWARAIGRVVVRKPRLLPVPDTFLEAAAGSPAACPAPTSLIGDPNDCYNGPGGYTNSDGLFAVVEPPVVASGWYSFVAYGRGFHRDGFYAPAYGNSGAVPVFIGPGPRTTVIGDIELGEPNFVGQMVDAYGHGVGDAFAIASRDDGADCWACFNYTRADGQYGYRFADGDYTVYANVYDSCTPMSGDPIKVHVRNGVADPPSAVIRMRSYPAAPPEPGYASAPLEPDGPGSALARVPTLAGEVVVRLDGVAGTGRVTASCQPSPILPPDTVLLDAPLDLHPEGVGFAGAEVCLPYQDARVAMAGTTEAALRLAHITPAGQFEFLPTRVDAAGNTICASTTSFSRFAVAAVIGSPPQPGPDGPAPTPTRERSGYWALTDTGQVYAFGDAGYHGGLTGATAGVVDIEPTPTGGGYWLVDNKGAVRAFGDARDHGSAAAPAAGEGVTSLSATPTGAGYWLFTSRGRVLPFGDARFLGDTSGLRLNGPVLDSVPTPTGRGYYMVASDGGIFTFGDARFFGSMGDTKLNAPVQSLVPDGDGVGYWLVASDGGIFSFEAPFKGSLGSVRLNKPVTGMVRYGNGYLMVAEDGGVFNFSDRPFAGSLGSAPPVRPVVAVAAVP